MPEWPIGTGCKPVGLRPTEVRILLCPPDVLRIDYCLSGFQRAASDMQYTSRKNAAEALFFGAPHSLSVLRKRIFCLERRTKSGRQAHVAQLAEHFLGKEEVSSSRLLVGSREILDSVCINYPKEAKIKSRTWHRKECHVNIAGGNSVGKAEI